ncbi:MAG TPA: DinB family protein, partial [Gemmataceae bacterium]|nr:DinB family protein [Gemmataceae bacterium]
MTSDQNLRKHLVDLLLGHNAHLGFEEAIADLPEALQGVRPNGLPHSPWRLLEHMRISQWDIMEFSRDANHVSPKWPAGYWPNGDAPPDASAWDQSVNAFRQDLQEMKDLVTDPKRDLLAPFPYGKGQTLLREAL